MRPHQVTTVRNRGCALCQLQHGRDPITLPDTGNDGFTGEPSFLRLRRFVRRRRNDTSIFASHVDACFFAEAILTHVTIELFDAHVIREFVIEKIHRIPDRLPDIRPTRATVRIAVTTALTGDKKLTRRKHLVIKANLPAFQTGQCNQWFDRRTWRTTTQHVTIKHRTRWVIHQRAILRIRNAVDERVRVVCGQRHHRQHFTRARIQRNGGTIHVTECIDRGLLQIDVDAQTQVDARLCRDTT